MIQTDSVADLVRRDFGNVYAVGVTIGRPLILSTIDDQTGVRQLAVTPTADVSEEPRHGQRPGNIHAIIHCRIFLPVDLENAVVSAAGFSAVRATRERDTTGRQIFPDF